MKKERLEAFSDAVVAIIMTILVLGIKIPDGYTLSSLWELKEFFITYILSFFLLGVTWHNHHHMLQIADRINGKVLWMNTLLLFSMSLLPFVTSWVGMHFDKSVPQIFYGIIFLMFNCSYALVTNSILEANGKTSCVYLALYGDRKIVASIVINIIAILLGFIYPPLVIIGCFIVTLIWFVPNRRVEKMYENKQE